MIFKQILLFFASFICFTVNAVAQDFPSKPVHIIIPFTAGSATDFVGRTVGQELSKMWDQPVVFENHAGAGGTIGAGLAAKASADGHTLLISAAYVASPALYKKLPYNPVKDFVDITPLAKQPMALLVGSSSGITSASEVVRRAKANPGEVKFASPGTGSIAHLAAEKFISVAEIDVVHIPYKGGPETVEATANGSATFSFLPLALARKVVKAGKLHALAVTSAKRTSAMPDVPTIAEAGFAGSESNIWWGIWSPAGTSLATVNKLNKDIEQALASPEVLQKFKEKALEPMSMSPVEFEQFVRTEMKSMKRIVKEAGIKPK